jgi:NitT/TauT family transport system substrate-binding protein
MKSRESDRFNVNRRSLVVGTAALGAASLLGVPLADAAEPPPERTRIRLAHVPAICLAPQYLAEELLRLEGFSHIEYVEDESQLEPYGFVATGRADLTMDAATALVPAIDDGRPVVVLAGVHGGCYELFGNDRVRAIRDLRGKSVGISAFGIAEHVYLASMMAYVGMDPGKDVNWVATGTFNGAMELFIDGKVDAFLGFPPQPQQVRAKKVGHVIVNTAQDRPWSQHFCCMIAGNPEFVRKNPVATKRAVRALLKAADVCVREPERVARYMVKKGYEANYAIALEVVKDVSYNAWRTFDPEATLRFHALRLYDVGMIKSTPQRLIAAGTDWRFLKELKRELKG